MKLEVTVRPNAQPEEYDALLEAYKAGKLIKFSHKGSVWTTSGSASFHAHNYYRVFNDADEIAGKALHKETINPEFLSESDHNFIKELVSDWLVEKGYTSEDDKMAYEYTIGVEWKA